MRLRQVLQVQGQAPRTLFQLGRQVLLGKGPNRLVSGDRQDTPIDTYRTGFASVV